MTPVIIAFLLVAAGVASAAPIYSSPVTYVALRSVPENIYNQAHDTKTGEYAFGYAGGPVAREESKTADGVIRGAYSYVDAHGMVQHYRYIADDDGFRVDGTNIPTDVRSASPIASKPETTASVLTAVAEVAATAGGSKESRSRKKRSAIYGDAVIAVRDAAASLATALGPTATSNQNGAQIDTRKAVGGIPAVSVDVPAIPVAGKTIGVVTEAIPVAVAGSVPVATSSQSRFQVHDNLKTEVPVKSAAVVSAVSVAVPAISVAGKTIGVVPEAIPAAVAGSVPVATSSQSRFQVHDNLKTVVPVKSAVVVPAVSVAVPAIPVAGKTIGVVPEAIPVAVAGSVPVATSSQSRFQVHNNLKTEVPVKSAAVVSAVSVAVPAIPVAGKSIGVVPEAIPVAVAGSVSISASSQSRFQVHDIPKSETSRPLAVKTVEAVPTVVPIATKTIAALPVTTSLTASASLPIATSSQSRVQIHKSLRTEVREPLTRLEVSANAVGGPVPLVAAIPVASETINRIAGSAPIAVAAAPLAAIATSNQRLYQTRENLNIEVRPLSQLSSYPIQDIQPAEFPQIANLDSSSIVGRSKVGVGLGVVPSPVAAYYGPGLLAQA